MGVPLKKSCGSTPSSTVQLRALDNSGWRAMPVRAVRLRDAETPRGEGRTRSDALPPGAEQVNNPPTAVDAAFRSQNEINDV